MNAFKEKLLRATGISIPILIIAYSISQVIDVSFGLAFILAVPFSGLIIISLLIIGIKNPGSNEVTKKNYPHLQVAEIFQKKRLKKGIYLFIVVLILIVCNSIYVHLQTSLIILVLLGSIYYFFETITKFRIRNGFYGNNEQEARELITFILNNKDEIDFTDEEGEPKKINPKTAAASVYDIIIDINVLVNNDENIKTTINEA